MKKIIIILSALGMLNVAVFSSGLVYANEGGASSQMEMSDEKEAMMHDDDTSTPYQNKISICKHSNKVRIISVIYQYTDTSVSCEVTYEKDVGVKTLWSAKADMSYCVEKAEGFIQKQEGWGWSCS